MDRITRGVQRFCWYAAHSLFFHETTVEYGSSEHTGNFTMEALQDLVKSPDVERIEEDGIVTIQSQVIQ